MTKPTTPSQPIPRLDELLCFLVYSTGSAFGRMYRKPLEKLGLTYPQYLVMVVLWNGDGLTVGQIGEQLGLDTGTLTPLLKRLETLGFLSRERSAEDERRVIVKLTSNGDQLRSQVADVRKCALDAVNLKPEDFSSLMRLLGTLRNNLVQGSE
jgi:DNA-binding MarR family transcriptional regulator